MGHEDFRRCVDSDTVSITSEKCVSEAGDDEMVVVEAEGRESRIHIQHKCSAWLSTTVRHLCSALPRRFPSLAAITTINKRWLAMYSQTRLSKTCEGIDLILLLKLQV
jgi:hypothetical protein